MTFLAPWAAWFLAGVPVIVLLYLLKLKRRPLTVSTLLFWERVMQENRQRALFQKLRQLLSLLLHLLIFLLILAALAKPAIDRLVREGASVVLVVDTRARMQATEAGGETRFARALQKARQYVREASAACQIAVLSAGRSPNVVTPFTGDERMLLNGLEKLAVTDAGGDLEPAITLADSLLASRKGDTRIVVLSDAAPGSEIRSQKSEVRDRKLRIKNQKSKISYLPCGSPHDNVGITRFATRPLLSSPETSEVLLAIKNFGRARVSGNVEITLDGKLLDVRPFTLDPDQETLDIFASVPRVGRGARGWLSARLDLPDALPLDNIAYAVLPPPTPRRVLLVSKGNWFVEKLLAADQRIKFELIEPDAWQPSFAAKFDAIIFDNFVPTGFSLAGAAGNFLFLKQSPFEAGDPPIEQPLISDSDSAHPALRLVNLQNVTILRAVATALPEPADGWTWEAPLRSFDHPLLITGTRQNGALGDHIAALAFDIAESDLPLRIAFPLLIANTVHWLTGEMPASNPGIVAGENLALAPGMSVATGPLTSPEVPVQPDPAKSASTFFQPLRNGFYMFSYPGGASWLAVNTFDKAESDLRSASSPAVVATSLPTTRLAAFTGWPLWQYLVLAALCLFTIEWWLFHRRRTE